MPKQDFYNEFYEKLHSGDKELTTEEEIRIKTTINLIPSDINSLLEVGCGDGRIINRLIGKYENICGLDISNSALKFVKTPKKKGNLENLPFQDKNFDLLMSCEVLEHIPNPIYKKALKEIERVSKEYILISVPNNENLKLEMIKCPKCGCSYHTSGHLRSYKLKNLIDLFENFKIVKTEILNISEPIMLNKLVILVKSISNISNQNSQITNLCPKCGYFPKYNEEHRNNSNKKANYLFNLLKKILPVKKRGGWILVLYKFNG